MRRRRAQGLWSLLSLFARLLEMLQLHERNHRPFLDLGVARMKLGHSARLLFEQIDQARLVEAARDVPNAIASNAT